MKIGRSDREKRLLTGVLRDVRTRYWSLLSRRHREMLTSYLLDGSMTSAARKAGLSISGVKRAFERLLDRYTNLREPVGAVVTYRSNGKARLVPGPVNVVDTVGLQVLLADPDVQSVRLAKVGDVADVDGRHWLGPDGTWKPGAPFEDGPRRGGGEANPTTEGRQHGRD